MFEGEDRRDYERRLRELQNYNRKAFVRYTDLLLAGEDHWDENQAALEAAANDMQEMLTEFMQPA